MTRGKAKQLRKKIEQASGSLPDEDALEAVELFPAWASGIEYAVDTRVRHGSLLYRCIQAHTSQDDWTPDLTPAVRRRQVGGLGIFLARSMSDEIDYERKDGKNILTIKKNMCVGG